MFVSKFLKFFWHPQMQWSIISGLVDQKDWCPKLRLCTGFLKMSKILGYHVTNSLSALLSACKRCTSSPFAVLAFEVATQMVNEVLQIVSRRTLSYPVHNQAKLV